MSRRTIITRVPLLPLRLREGLPPPLRGTVTCFQQSVRAGSFSKAGAGSHSIKPQQDFNVTLNVTLPETLRTMPLRLRKMNSRVSAWYRFDEGPQAL